MILKLISGAIAIGSLLVRKVPENEISVDMRLDQMRAIDCLFPVASHLLSPSSFVRRPGALSHASISRLAFSIIGVSDTTLRFSIVFASDVPVDLFVNLCIAKG